MLYLRRVDRLHPSEKLRLAASATGAIGSDRTPPEAQWLEPDLRDIAGFAIVAIVVIESGRIYLQRETCVEACVVREHYYIT